MNFLSESPVQGVGNQHEFEALFQETRHRAYRFAYRLTGNGDDAEDLTQDAYLRAYNAFDRYDRNVPFLRWLFRILHNLFLDRCRRAKIRKEFSLNQTLGIDEGGRGLCVDVADPAANPERQYLTTIMDARLERALTWLPEPYRVAVVMHDVEEWSYEEIATATHTCLGTVRSRIHRGRTMLRKYLTDARKVSNHGDAFP